MSAGAGTPNWDKACLVALRLGIVGAIIVFHTIALDGVYVRGEDGELRFHPLDPPSWEDVAQVAAWTFEKLTRVGNQKSRFPIDVSRAGHTHLLRYSSVT